jgi:hypothetical protein
MMEINKTCTEVKHRAQLQSGDEAFLMPVIPIGTKELLPLLSVPLNNMIYKVILHKLWYQNIFTVAGSLLKSFYQHSDW